MGRSDSQFKLKISKFTIEDLGKQTVWKSFQIFSTVDIGRLWIWFIFVVVVPSVTITLTNHFWLF